MASNRWCTCDVYTSGSYGNAGPASITNWSYSCSSNTSDCVTYDALTTCLAYSSNCAATNNTHYVYNCPGHRALNAHGNISFEIYSTGSQIRILLLNTILRALHNEIAERKRHALYATSIDHYNGIPVSKGELLLVTLNNSIVSKIKEIKNLINLLKDHATTYRVSALSVESDTIAYANTLKKLETDINTMWKDCICYSDCTVYGLWKYRTCTCNVNCGCNYYSDERLKNSIIYLYSCLLKINVN